jgi:16S rRNA processing protein RimM
LDNETGEKIGVITDVSDNGAHENYLIKTDDGEFLLPAVPEFIKETDINSGIIRVKLIDGIKGV